MSALLDALSCAHSAVVSLDTALAILLERADARTRDLAQGWTGATAMREMREAKKRAARARDLLELIAPKDEAR